MTPHQKPYVKGMVLHGFKAHPIHQNLGILGLDGNVQPPCRFDLEVIGRMGWV